MTSDESGTFAILGVDDGVATQPAVWPWGFTHFGERAQALGRPRVINRGRIEIHDDVVIDSRISPAEFITAPGGRIVVGRGTVIEHGALLLARRLVELGDRVARTPS